MQNANPSGASFLQSQQPSFRMGQQFVRMQQQQPLIQQPLQQQQQQQQPQQHQAATMGALVGASMASRLQHPVYPFNMGTATGQIGYGNPSLCARPIGEGTLRQIPVRLLSKSCLNDPSIQSILASIRQSIL